MDVFDLSAKISLDSSDYKKGLDKAEGLASKFGAGLKKAGEIGIKAIGVASTAIGGLATKSIKDYAEYEQLVGGVETLFKKSADKVQKYADQAFETAGMSANEYMETVTSFSASLLQSLGGDTEKASKYADRALTDMSDNANKMGTDMENIQNAYQGFAKQNYTMLDNLKLGYGGTKGEMERLIQDASKLKDVQKELGITVDSNSMSFGNIVNAISVVQKNMGIMGTTSEEAKKTIEGSVKAMKASFENLTTGLTDDKADLPKLIENFTNSITVVWDNIEPRVGQLFDGISKLVTTMFPKVFKTASEIINKTAPTLIEQGTSLLSEVISVATETFPSLLMSVSKIIIKSTPNLIDAFGKLMSTLSNTIIQEAPSLIDTMMNVGFEILDSLFSGMNSALGKVEVIITMLGDKIKEYLPTIIEKVVEFIPNLAKSLIDMMPIIIQAITDIVVGIAEKLPDILATLIEQLPELIDSVVSALVSSANIIFDALMQVVDIIIPQLPSLITSFVEALTSSVDLIINGAIELFSGLIQALPTVINNLVSALPQLVSAIVNALVNALPQILQGAIQMFMAVVNAIPVIIPKLIDMLPQIIETVCDILLDNIPLILDAGIQLFMGIVDAIPEIIRKLVPMIPKIVISVEKALWKSVPKLLGTLGAIWVQLASTIIDLGKRMTEKIPQIIADIVVAFESGIEDMKEVGGNIIMGLWDGINGAKDWLLDKLGKLIDLLPKSVRKILGIESPSKVFAQIGTYMAEGLGVGWDATFPSIQDDITKSMDFSSKSFTIKSASNPQNSSLRADIASMTEAIVTAIEESGNTTIELNSREVGRMVRQYA